MDQYFEVKMVGYQHESMRRELRRVVHDQLGGGLRDLLAAVGRVLSVVLCVALFVWTALYALGASMIEVPNAEVIMAVMLAFCLALLVVAVGYRKRADPLKDCLWPPEATVVTVTFFADFIQANDPRVVSQLRYPAIPAILETGAAYYLFAGDEHVLMLRKREFTQGDPELFREFIAEKTGKPVEYIK